MPGQRITQLPSVTNILPTDFFITARGSTTFKVPGSLLGTKADITALSAIFPTLARRTDLTRVSSSVVQLSTLTVQALQTVATTTQLTTTIGGLSAQVDSRFATKVALNSYVLKPNTAGRPTGAVLTWNGTDWIAGDNLSALSGFNTIDVAPVGSIIYFPTPNAPQGYLVCDGRGLNVGVYSELFAVLGYRYGGSGATFNLPDLRGEFVRGWSGTRTNVDAGRAFGTVQSDLVKSHAHGINDPGHVHTINDPGHIHTLVDPGHVHTISDPGHSHGVTDPGHSHGIYDAGHTHPMTLIENYNGIGSNRNTDRGGGSNASRAGALPLGYTGIWIHAASTNLSIQREITRASIITGKTNASILGAGTNVTINNAGSNITVAADGGIENRPRNIAMLPCIKYTQVVATATTASLLSSFIPKPTTISTNQYLSYNGTQWVGSNPLSLLPTGSQGQLLTWNNGSWTAGQGLTPSINASTAFVITNLDTISWAQIPATAKRLTITISRLVLGTEDLNSIQLKLGTANGIVAAGYQGISTVSYIPIVMTGSGADLYNTGIATNCFPLMVQIPKSSFASLLGTNNRATQKSLDTIITLMKSGTNTWVMSHSGRLGSLSTTQGGGSVDLSGPLTQIQLTTNNPSIKMTGGNALLYIE